MSSIDPSDCNDCPLIGSRRVFFRQAVGQLSAAFLISGIATSLMAQTSTDDSKTYAIADNDGVQIDRDNDVILVRSLGSIYAFSLNCPHQNTPLQWFEKTGHFKCPKHHSEYATDGYFIKGRATRSMDRYAIRRVEKTVVVDLKTLYKESDDAKVWAAAAVTV